MQPDSILIKNTSTLNKKILSVLLLKNNPFRSICGSVSTNNPVIPHRSIFTSSKDENAKPLTRERFVASIFQNCPQFSRGANEASSRAVASQKVSPEPFAV